MLSDAVYVEWNSKLSKVLRACHSKWIYDSLIHTFELFLHHIPFPMTLLPASGTGLGYAIASAIPTSIYYAIEILPQSQNPANHQRRHRNASSVSKGFNSIIWWRGKVKT